MVMAAAESRAAADRCGEEEIAAGDAWSGAAEGVLDEFPGERGKCDGDREDDQLRECGDRLVAGAGRAGLVVVKLGEDFYGPVPEVERVRDESDEDDGSEGECAADE